MKKRDSKMKECIGKFVQKLRNVLEIKECIGKNLFQNEGMYWKSFQNEGMYWNFFKNKGMH